MSDQKEISEVKDMARFVRAAIAFWNTVPNQCGAREAASDGFAARKRARPEYTLTGAEAMFGSRAAHALIRYQWGRIFACRDDDSG